MEGISEKAWRARRGQESDREKDKGGERRRAIERKKRKRAIERETGRERRRVIE